MPTLTTKKYNQ